MTIQKSRQVKIGPNFFAKVFNDYGDWRFAYAREAIQNSLDAPRSTAFDVTVERDGANTVVTFENNGRPMSEAELTDKLLALGESGKDFVGAVGGFGKAKEILMFCHEHYDIWTGSLHVTGRGGDYILEQANNLNGTRTRVVLKGDQVTEMIAKFRRVLLLTQWSGTATVNGDYVPTNFKKGVKKREFSWGKVYTNRSIHNSLVVRIGGVPMFIRYLECKKRCVVIELTGKSGDVLQSNRDNLRWEQREELDAFCDEVLVNKRSALDEDDEPVYLRYSGDKLKRIANARLKQSVEQIINAAYATTDSVVSQSDEAEAAETVEVAEEDAPSGDRPRLSQVRPVAREIIPTETEKRIARSTLRFDFVIKNTTKLKTPSCYQPFDFSSYSKKLAKSWAACLLAIHELFERDDEFSVGFIFSESAEAEYEFSQEHGRTYFINPCCCIKQKASASRSFAKRWKLTPQGKMAILAVAAHEFVHGLGFGAHDESYSNKLTEVMGVIMTNLKRFHRCFR